jgi:hypothetical protein
MRSTPRTLLTSALLLALGGCTVITSTSDTVCGPGTTLEGDACVADGSGAEPTSPGDPGDGTPGDGTPGDGTPDDGTVPGGGPAVPPTGDPPGEDPSPDLLGCDEASGECDAWRDALLAAVVEHQRGFCGEGPEIDPRIVEIAQDHADHQAEIDALDAASSPELFDRVYEAGVIAPQMAAAYSQTVEGPGDVIARWLRRGTDAGILTDRCDLYVGAGVATNPESGWSYVTLLAADYRG